MIVLILAPGVSIDSSQISQLIQRVSWQPDSPPRLLSSIQFHPDDQTKFLSDLSIPDQCRLAIQGAVSVADARSENGQEDRHFKDMCRTIVISGRLHHEDLVALAAWNKVCTREFTAKSLVVLGTEERLEHDILIHCLAQSYPLSSVFEEDVKLLDLVAPCVVADCEGIVGLSESNTVPVLEAELLKGSQTRWNITDLVPIQSTLNFPILLLSTGLKIMFPGCVSITTGLYSAKLNSEWFALLRVTGTNSAELSIAPRVFSELFSKISKKKEKPATIARPITPPLTQNYFQRLRATNSFSDHTISLAGWTASQDNPSPRASDRNAAAASNEALKEDNKTNLKKLLLLSLRHVGVDKNHPEFLSIWKHLYCGCLFALRRDLAHDRISQSTMLSVIKTNMNFLNVSREPKF